MQANMDGTVRVVIGLDDHLGELKSALNNIPFTPKALFGLIFKLWELKYKHPAEYVDELFSSVTDELYKSPLLAKQLDDANRLNHNGLSKSEVVDAMINISVSRVNAAIQLLDKPLTRTIKPLLDNYRAAIEDVTVFSTICGINFEVVLSVSTNPEFQGRYIYSAYDNYLHRMIVNSKHD